MYDSIGAATYRWLRATSSRHRPWQVAVAVACGVLAGGCLTTSPLGVLLLLALFLTPIHFVLAAGTAITVAAMSTWAMPWLAQLGEQSLSQPEVVAFVGQVHSVPGLAWLRLNNTVVHGGVVFGLVQFLPTLVAGWWFTVVCRECHDDCPMRAAKPMRREGMEQLTAPTHPALTTRSIGVGVDESLSLPLAAMQPSNESPTDFPFSELHFWPIDAQSVETQPSHADEARAWFPDGESAEASTRESRSSDAAPPGLRASQNSQEASWERRTQDTVSRLEQALESARGGGSTGDAHDVAKRAAHLASLVDEMLEMLEMLEQSQIQVVEPAADAAIPQWPVVADPNDRQGNAQDELSRRAEDQEASAAQDRAPSDGSAFKTHDAHSQIAGPNTGEHASLERVAENEQALRYLLHHLRKIKNRV